jgi:hypothetical protein
LIIYLLFWNIPENRDSVVMNVLARVDGILKESPLKEDEQRKGFFIG